MTTAMMSEETPTVIPSTFVPACDTVTLTPVPVEDISACAKLTCSLCCGRGKLTIKEVGSDKSEVSVCNCALKRFVAANRRRLAVGRDKTLFYRTLPEGVVDTADSAETEDSDLGVKVEGNNDGVLARFRVMIERLAIIDKELGDLSTRYDLKKEPLEQDVQATEKALAVEQSSYEDLKVFREALSNRVKQLNQELDELAKTAEKLRSTRDQRIADVAVADVQLGTLHLALQPFISAHKTAKDRLDEHQRRRYQAMKPHEQRKASLLKRMQHKAASLGLSVSDIEHKLMGDPS